MTSRSFTEYKGTLKQLLPFLRPYVSHMALALLAVTGTASTVLVFGWGLRNLVDEGFSDQSGHYLNHALLTLFGVILVLAAASYTRFYTVSFIAEKSVADLRKALYRHLLSLDPAFFETHKTGDQVSRINNDTGVLQLVMTTNLPMAFRNLIIVAGGIVMLLVVSPMMTAMVLASVPLVVGPIIYFGRRVRSRSRDTQGRIGDMASLGQETLQGLQTIQSFGYETEATARFGVLADETFHAAMRYVRVRAFLVALIISVVFTAIGIVLWMGGHAVLTGKLTAGSLSAFIFYAVTTAGSVGALSEVMSAFNQAIGAADRIASLLARQPELKGTQGGAPAPEKIAGRIAFDNVSFHYPTRPAHKALDAVSFTVDAGQHVALVGPSGAGKSTVFHLLQRFYDPQGGVIRIDGADISGFEPRSLRAQIGVVAQDPAIFSLSVADNIRLGRPDASDAEVQAAAQLAQAHEFIMALPQGYDTPVGERGSRLSGGQRQRIAIARVALKNPPILLLDEATSALDSANEQAVMQALKRLTQGRTTLVIAHRLSTVQNADKIIVFDQGRVVAEGAHDALYGQNGLYTRLAGLQMQAPHHAVGE